MSTALDFHGMDPLLPWLTVQERFDRARAGWRGAPVADLAYPNPMDATGPALVAVREAIGRTPPPYLQYTPYGGATVPRRLVAERLSEAHGLRFDWRDVILTPGAMAALAITFRMLAGPGAQVVVPVPCWLDYPLYLANQGITPVLVSQERTTLRLDVDAIAARLGPATRAVLLTQPGNPTGIVVREEEVAAVAAAVRERAPHAWIVSDECHRDWVFDGAPVASIPQHHERSVVIYSFGKAFLMQGQRIGYVAVSPKLPEETRVEVRRFLERACRFMSYCTPTALMQSALQQIARYKPDVALVAERNARATRVLREAGYEVVPGRATFFLYVKSPEPEAMAFVEKLARRGVFVLPSDLFHHAGYFRLSLTAADEEIDRGLEVLAALRKEIVA